MNLFATPFSAATYPYWVRGVLIDGDEDVNSVMQQLSNRQVLMEGWY